MPASTKRLGARLHASVVRVNTAIPATRGRRRPWTSLKGPESNCPSASPSRYVVTVTWAADGLASKSRASSGSPGR